MQSQTISITFAARAQPDAPRRFSGVAYSGGVIPHYGWMGDVAIDLATLQNAQGEQLPILIDHDQRIDAIAGRGRIFKTADADGLPFLAVEGEISQATEAGRRVAALFAEGHPVQLSVGMHANVRQVSDPISINGRSGLKVAALFENAIVREVSFVAVGADPNTEAHAFAATSSPKEPPNMPDATETIGALQARVERAWLEEQTPDVLVELAARVLEVNADFFVQRVLPTIEAAANRLNTTISGGSASSSSSPAAASPTSEPSI